MPVIAYIRTWSWTCHLAGHVICVRRNLEDGDTYDVIGTCLRVRVDALCDP